MNERVAIAKITGVHGIKGLVTVKPYSDEETSLTAYGPLQDKQGNFYTLAPQFPKKGVWVCKVPEIPSRDAAEALGWIELYTDVSNLPDLTEDETYHRDLIGLKALSETSEPIGTVKAILTVAARDILEIERSEAEPLLVPFTKEDVPSINLKTGTLTIAKRWLTAATAEETDQSDAD